MSKNTKNIYYNGINNLLKADVQQDYEKWQIKEIKKCRKNIPYFLKTYVKIIHQERGKVPFELYQYQKKFIKLVQNNNRFIALQARQSGKTAAVSGFILHYIIFNSYKNVTILANKGAKARKILHVIKEFYKSLPLWLQQGVKEWNKGSIELGNGCFVEAMATTDDSARGDSIALLYIDETAFIPKEKWEPFWTSSYPTISSSRSAKIVMSSTPRGLNHFYKLWTDAQNSKNGFVTFKVTWKDVPYYDAAWEKATKKEMNYDSNPAKFDAEYNCEFKGSAGTLIAGAKLEMMPIIDPIEIRYDGKFLIYQYPDPKRKYVLFSDFAEGDGQNYTTCSIIDVTELPWKQVATYRDNEILVGEAPLILDKIGKFYHNALVIGEANTIGIGILDDLNYDLEYENLFFGDRLASGKLSKYFGIKTTPKSKRIGNSYLREYIENDSLEVVDYHTINELNNYIRQKNGTYSADEGEMDDTVMPLVLFSYFMQNKVYVDEWLNTDVHNRNEKREKKIEEDLLPAGYYSDGDEFIDLEADDDDDDGLDWLNFV